MKITRFGNQEVLNRSACFDIFFFTLINVRDFLYLSIYFTLSNFYSQKNKITVSLRVNGNRHGKDESFIAWTDLPGAMSKNLWKNKEAGGRLDMAPLNLWPEIETLFKCSIKSDPVRLFVKSTCVCMNAWLSICAPFKHLI